MLPGSEKRSQLLDAAFESRRPVFEKKEERRKKIREKKKGGKKAEKRDLEVCDPEDCGGGVYLWESRAAAEAWFNDEWWGWIEERFGARPTLTYFDHYVTVDNAAGEIRVDGVATAIAAE